MGVPFDLTALSGINGASKGLAVISNNLANAQTVAFKSARAEFADIFYGNHNSPGMGVRVAAVTEDFGQGTLNSTGRPLDLGIDGEGFFILEDQTGKYDRVYTRNGSFKIDKEGFLTAQDGSRVMGYRYNKEMSTDTNPVFETTLSTIDLDELAKKPKATEKMAFDINLDGQEDNNVDSSGNSVGSDTANNLDKLVDSATNGAYDGFPDFSTNKLIYDSLGGEHRLTANYYKRDVVTAANSTLDVNGDGANDKYTSWIVQYTLEDKDPATGEWVTSGHRYDTTASAATADIGLIYELRFDTNGNLVDIRAPSDNSNPVGQDTANSELPAASWTSVGKKLDMNWIVDNPLTGATDPLGNPVTLSISADYTNATMYAGSYGVRGVDQDGYPAAGLVGFSASADGTIEARYSNGMSMAVARLALANFPDKQQLDQLGGQRFAQTYMSGSPVISVPEANGFGSIESAALEFSNVDVAGELVNMIQTQRMYQANAQMISTSKELTQVILNL